MVRKVTLTGGVLNGKSFLVADDSEALIHHAAHGGRYVLSGAYGEWVADVTALADANPSLGHAVDPAALASLAEPTGLDRVVAKAAAGYRVLVVAQRRKDAVDEVRALVDNAHVAGAVKRVSRASGSERITFESGGFIVPVGLTGSRGSRGISADVLYLVDVTKDAPALADVLPSLNGSTDSSIIIHGEA